MPVNPSAEELYTTVENMSDAERTCGFLGPRGMTLAPGEIVLIPGNLVATLGAEAARGKRRRFEGLERSMKAGRIRINSTPAPVLYDPEDEVPKSLAISGGVLGTVDPDYNEHGSVEYTPV